MFELWVLYQTSLILVYNWWLTEIENFDHCIRWCNTCGISLDITPPELQVTAILFLCDFGFAPSPIWNQSKWSCRCLSFPAWTTAAPSMTMPLCGSHRCTSWKELLHGRTVFFVLVPQGWKELPSEVRAAKSLLAENYFFSLHFNTPC